MGGEGGGAAILNGGSERGRADEGAIGVTATPGRESWACAPAGGRAGCEPLRRPDSQAGDQS